MKPANAGGVSSGSRDWKQNPEVQTNTEQTLVIKVGDLLHKQGSQDVVVLPNLIIGDSIANVSWTVVLTGVSDDELYAAVKELSYDLQVPCDYCGEEKTFSKVLPDQNYSFMLEHLITPEIEEEEVIFPIWPDVTIDLYSVIRDTILLADEVQHICEACQTRLDTSEEDQKLDSNEDGHIAWNIVFT